MEVPLPHNQRSPRVMILGEWPDGSARSIGGPRRFNKCLCESIEAAGQLLLNPRRLSLGESKLAQCGAILRGVLKSRPAVIHITTEGFHVVFALLSKALFGSVIVYSVHSLVKVWPEVRNSSSLTGRIRTWFVEATMRRFADCAVFPSENYELAAREAGYRFRRTQTVHHGSNPEGTLPPRGQPPFPLRFSIFGPALRVKGTQRAARILREIGHLGEVHWIGYDSSDRFQSPCSSAPGDSRRVEFHPPVPPDQINRELERTAITLMPSLRESFGIVALESISAGVPVIVSDTSGVSEIVSGTRCGVVIDFDHPSELVHAVETILESYSSYSAMAVRCGQSHTWREAAMKYLSIYRTLRPVDLPE